MGDLFIARSWMQEWDKAASKMALQESSAVFFVRKADKSYVPANDFHFETLVLGGKFPALEDPLFGLDPQDTAIMEIMDPDVELVPNVHMRNHGISQILIDINVMTEAEAHYLRGSHGLHRVIQSNIGGPNKSISDLSHIAYDWINGETPGCNCLICSRVPGVLAKLKGQSALTPPDVLPLTTVPRLAQVVDVWLQPRIKVAIGSQGYLGSGQYQTYPSAAVGFLNYPQVAEDAQLFRKVPDNFDPQGVFQQSRAPDGYRYTYGIFWELGKDVFRSADDPDRHVFGFIFVKKDARLSGEDIQQEVYRFQPRRESQDELLCRTCDGAVVGEGECPGEQ